MDDRSARNEQLDFYQAMDDFKHMFPFMEEEVIEAVLRAHNGAVDDTIDQLLTMSVDTARPETVTPQQPLGTDGVPIADNRWLDPIPEEKDTDSLHNGARCKELAPMPPQMSLLQHQYIPSTKPPAVQSPFALLDSVAKSTSLSNSHSSSTLCCESNPTASAAEGSSAGLRAIITSMPAELRLGACASSTSNTLPNVMLTSKWQTAMIGKLPDDFLRIATCSNGCEPTNQAPVVVHQIAPRWADVPCEFHARQKNHNYHHEMTTIARRMVKNQAELSEETDPERTRFLHDEHLALMQQNEEFLAMLRADREFMAALLKDQVQHCHSRNAKDAASSSVSLLPSEDSSDFKNQLRYMGKFSKAKFTDLARKFFAKTKKKKDSIRVQGTIAPVALNALEGEEEPRVRLSMPATGKTKAVQVTGPFHHEVTFGHYKMLSHFSN